MTLHPRSRGNPSASEVGRVVKISQKDIIDPSPDTLTLLKRVVNKADLLEVSNNASWTAKVATITDKRIHGLFEKSRPRYRYYFYGLEKVLLQNAVTTLTALFP